MQEFILKNLITILFIIFLVYGFVRGFSQGFAKRLLSIGSIIVAIIATKFLTPIVAGIVKDATSIESSLTDMFYNIVANTGYFDSLNLQVGGANLNSSNGSIMDFISKNIGGLSIGLNTEEILQSIKDTICVGIANAIINLVCGIVVFIAMLIVIKILVHALGIIDYIPILGQINKFLGGVLGVVEVIIAVWIILTIVRVLETVPQIGVLAKNINESFIIGYFYKNNLIYSFLSNLFLAITGVKAV